MYLPIGAWLTTRRDILLLLSDCKFLRFTVTAMRFTSHFDGSLAPKVVQIIVSYNNLHAFFAIFRVFRGFFEISDANFGSAGPLFADGGGRNEPCASCSPPRWGGGELRAGVTPVLRKAHRYSGRGLRGSRNERMRIAGLRGAEAAARTTLRVVSNSHATAKNDAGLADAC